MQDGEERELCEVHGVPLEDFVSATEEGTEYFTFCPLCEEELESVMLREYCSDCGCAVIYKERTIDGAALECICASCGKRWVAPLG